MAADERTPSVKCPNCGRPARYAPANPFRPFCSERCKLLDLGQWATEKYRIAGDDAHKDAQQADED